jgi:phospholipid/cholesterol/gamma-HCH transport system substrate-binding protein
VKADSRTKSRVGIIVFATLILFAVAIFVIGGKAGFFIARTSYFTRFPNSLGLVGGNQVRLAGVTVGTVQSIDVPKQPGQDLTIHFDIERKYQHLVKADSRVEIKTIGLLGDKYLEVTTGSAGKPDLAPDSEIKAYRGAELEKILAGSGDLVDNVVAITKSLKVVLGRTEKGEGFLGELVTDSEAGKQLSRSLRQTLDSANLLLSDLRTGKGLVGRLVNDEAYGKTISAELQGSVTSLHHILAAVDKGTSTGEGLIPALLSDPEGKRKVFAMVDSLKATADGLAGFSRDLSAGDGLVSKLVKDDRFAKEFMGDLKSLSGHLANVAAKLDSTEGTVGKLIADPAVYDAINDVIVGVDQSKPLRWLIRNRQKSGIEKRYQDAQPGTGGEAAAPTPEAKPTQPGR